jgi:Leucine-rich repeat (LRR) protein
MKKHASRTATLGCSLLLALTVSSSVSAISGLQEQIPASEYAALLDIYSNTQGQGWIHQDGWTDPSAPDWYNVIVWGVKHDFQTGQIISQGTVIGLGLDNNQLTGSIPESLANLVNLKFLRLAGNQLSGNIPAILGNLSSLQILDLTGNELSGNIPDALGNLINLQEISLSHNQLDGSVPTNFGTLVNLYRCALEDNQLSGTIPDFATTAPSLYALSLEDNCFDATSNSDFTEMINKLLEAGKTPIYQPQKKCGSGLIPGLAQQIPPSEYAALVDLFLSTGGTQWFRTDGWTDPSAPAWYGVTVSGFEYDSEIGHILKVGTVTTLHLSANHLVGHLAETLGNLVNLEELVLSSNSSPEVHTDLGRLEGTIPDSLGNLTKLVELDLSYDKFGGGIPESLGNLVNLRTLNLGVNQLSGAIPVSLLNLVNLEHLSFGGSYYRQTPNMLSGDIPDFSVLASLESLDITDNCLDISPGSQVRSVIQKMTQAGKTVYYQPQNPDCAPALRGDLNSDGCVDRADLAILMGRLRWNDLTYDLNGDGKLDIADARYLVLHFTNPGGGPCAP